jgi:hypothetical protein
MTDKDRSDLIETVRGAIYNTWHKDGIANVAGVARIAVGAIWARTEAARAESAKELAEKDGAWICAGHGANFTQDCDECWWVKRCNEKDAEIERLKRAVAELASENAALKQSVIAANLDSDVWQTASNARDKEIKQLKTEIGGLENLLKLERDKNTRIMRESDAEIERIAGAIHWPDYWDTAAYPTLLSAIQEIGGWPELRPLL